MFLFSALNPRWVSAAETSVMVVNMPASNNWQIGTTLDGMFRPGLPSPFTNRSMTKFEEAWNNLDEWEQQGYFTMKSSVVSSQSDFVEMMDVGGSLSISWMMLSV